MAKLKEINWNLRDGNEGLQVILSVEESLEVG